VTPEEAESDMANDEPLGEVRFSGSLGFFGQTALLFKKNFLSKKRQERKKLFGVR